MARHKWDFVFSPDKTEPEYIVNKLDWMHNSLYKCSNCQTYRIRSLGRIFRKGLWESYKKVIAVYIDKDGTNIRNKAGSCEPRKETNGKKEI